MSFSYDLKKELSTVEDAPRHCRMAELSAFILFLASRENDQILLRAANILSLQTASSLIRKLFRAEAEPVPDESRKRHMIVLTGDALCKEITRALKCAVSPDGRVIPDIRQLLSKNCCKRAFLRGAFLCAGTISDPDRSYHMEISCRAEPEARITNEVLRALQIDSKYIRRDRYYSLYIKDSDVISDTLGIMGARVSLLELENRRIVHYMRGSVNRKVNCETANIGKAAAASARQIEDIQFIYENDGARLLTGGLEEVARLRMEHPEATLQELSEMLDPPIGKSGINHRLRKITRIAQQMGKTRPE